MNATRTIDVKGLRHAEKEELIWPGIDTLAVGDTLQVALEFNPAPLVHLLRARGDFEVAYEKEGPDEWILNIKRIAPEDNKKQQFKDLLKELRKGDLSEDVKGRAKTLLETVDATALGILEQELINEGVSQDEIRGSLCDIHLEVMKDSLVSNRIEVQAPHPVHTLMEEHVVILDTLQKLTSLVERLKTKDSFEDLGSDLKALQDVSHYLVEAERHHQREEDCLFPALEKRNITEPPAIMRADHVELRKRKKELYDLAHNAGDYEFGVFKKRVVDLGEYITRELASHIFKEDNILYQIGLQVLSPDEWAEIKAGCDRIGYCFYSPAYTRAGGDVVELDLRPLPPFERHEKIFEGWDGLKPGEALRIINDHDPKPLHYQFEAEQKGLYEWRYEQNGPKDWAVTIKKV